VICQVVSVFSYALWLVLAELALLGSRGHRRSAPSSHCRLRCSDCFWRSSFHLVAEEEAMAAVGVAAARRLSHLGQALRARSLILRHPP
jgi:hypothetical protein